jgi:hypothetical protein
MATITVQGVSLKAALLWTTGPENVTGDSTMGLGVNDMAEQGPFLADRCYGVLP